MVVKFRETTRTCDPAVADHQRVQAANLQAGADFFHHLLFVRKRAGVEF